MQVFQGVAPGNFRLLCRNRLTSQPHHTILRQIIYVELNVPHKIGSEKYLARNARLHCSQGKPMMLTSDATMSEIDEAVRTIEATGNKDLVLMQCITNYPSKLDSANVNVLKTYQSAFDILTGYSDHSPGPVVALASVV